MATEMRAPDTAGPETDANVSGGASSSGAAAATSDATGQATRNASNPTRWIILAAVVCVAFMTAGYFWQQYFSIGAAPTGFPTQAELPLVTGEEVPLTQQSISGRQHAAAFIVGSEAAQLRALEMLRESGYQEIGLVDGGPTHTVASMVNDAYAVRVEFTMPDDDTYLVHYVMAALTDSSGDDAETD